ncbi:hypothetical protein AUP68_11106 [Ilyonectria robusta]
MTHSESPSSLQRSRSRSPSPSDQLRPRKRQRQTRQAWFSPPLLKNRPQSASSIATNIGQYYGLVDEGALENLFASYPQSLSTFPRPHGSQGLNEPPWELRFDQEIHLSNDFPSGRRRSQRIRAPIRGPETDPLPSYSPPQSAQRPPTATRAEFESALKLVREVVGEGWRLTLELVQSYERDACAADEVLTTREYMGSSSEYLGELRTAISSKGLGLINKQYRLARKAMPTGKNPFPEPLGNCSDDCSVSIELGIPCYHKVYSKLGSATPFTKWEVHPRWRLREPSSQDPYRRILDPKIATALRDRPKNTAQAVPARLAITAGSQSTSQLAGHPADQPTGRKRGRPAGSRNKSTLARLELVSSQPASSQERGSFPRKIDLLFQHSGTKTINNINPLRASKIITSQ